MTKFEEKDCYSIAVDKDKNRLNLLFLGHWKNPSEVPKYIDHVTEAVGMLKKGYTIVAEIRDKKPPNLKVTSIHKKGQQIMKQGGVSKTAVILAKGQFLQKMTLNVVGRLSGLWVKTFTDTEEGIAWLDEKVEK